VKDKTNQSFEMTGCSFSRRGTLLAHPPLIQVITGTLGYRRPDKPIGAWKWSYLANV